MERVAKLFEAGKIGSAELEKYTVTEEQARWAGIRDSCPPDPGDYIRLLIDGQLYMSDTKFEYYTNREFLYNAHGDVMIAGLGIGLVIKNMMPKILDGTITSITIYEKYRDVIGLCGRQSRAGCPRTSTSDASKQTYSSTLLPMARSTTLSTLTSGRPSAATTTMTWCCCTSVGHDVRTKAVGWTPG